MPSGHQRWLSGKYVAGIQLFPGHFHVQATAKAAGYGHLGREPWGPWGQEILQVSQSKFLMIAGETTVRGDEMIR